MNTSVGHTHGDLTIEVAGEVLTLLPERAVWWPSRRSLLVTDVHFGKSSVFRSHGLAVPAGSTDDNLARLSACLARYPATRLLCLGDLTHARAGHTPQVIAKLAAFRQRHAGLQIELVRGNHDRHAGVPEVLHATVLSEPLCDGPFSLWHEVPERRDEHTCGGAATYALAGHVHPAIVLSVQADHLRVPCFVFGPHEGILPAFGAFTGMHTLDIAPDMRYYPALDDSVLGPVTGRATDSAGQ